MKRSSYWLFILVAFLSMAQLGLPRRLRRAHLLVTDFAAAPSDWPQFNFDSRHSGSNAEEQGIDASNVATLRSVRSVTSITS